MVDVSIIIVHYNAPELLKRCVDSIYRYCKETSFEVIVVDNASVSVPDLEHQVILIKNKENLGFAKANNIGIKQATGKYVFLLNQDTELKENSIKKMYDLFAKSEIGVVGCRLELENRKIDKSCKRSLPTLWNSFFYLSGLSRVFPQNRLFASYQLTHLDEFGTFPVEAISGACMLIKKDVLNKVGLLDETFFMYGEDLDLCKRIREAGSEIWYTGSTTMIHRKGSIKKRDAKVVRAFYDSAWQYFQKHHAKKHSRITSLIVKGGIEMGSCLAQIRNAMRR